MAELSVDVGSIGSHFESLSDPRHTRNRKHLLVDIAEDKRGQASLFCFLGRPRGRRVLSTGRKRSEEPFFAR